MTTMKTESGFFTLPTLEPSNKREGVRRTVKLGGTVGSPRFRCQFERYGFARFDNDENGIKVFYFAHA